MNNSKYNISQASRLTGKARNTISRHLDSGKLSYELDAGGNRLIDGSELARVYPDCFDPHGGASGKSQRIARSSDPSDNEQGLRSQMSSLEQQLATEKEERKREREQLQQQIDRLDEALGKAQEAHNKAMLLLEHRSAGGGELEKGFKALEARVANQETAFKEQLSQVKQNSRRETIDELKSKSWLGVFRALWE